MPMKDGPVETICVVCEKVHTAHVTKSRVAEEFRKPPNALTRATTASSTISPCLYSIPPSFVNPFTCVTSLGIPILGTLCPSYRPSSNSTPFSQLTAMAPMEIISQFDSNPVVSKSKTITQRMLG